MTAINFKIGGFPSQYDTLEEKICGHEKYNLNRIFTPDLITDFPSQEENFILCEWLGEKKYRSHVFLYSDSLTQKKVENIYLEFTLLPQGICLLLTAIGKPRFQKVATGF